MLFTGERVCMCVSLCMCDYERRSEIGECLSVLGSVVCVAFSTSPKLKVLNRLY